VPVANPGGTTGDYAERGRQILGFHSGDRVYFATTNTGEGMGFPGIALADRIYVYGASARHWIVLVGW
jgi:hypothetical protein